MESSTAFSAPSLLYPSATVEGLRSTSYYLSLRGVLTDSCIYFSSPTSHKPNPFVRQKVLSSIHPSNVHIADDLTDSLSNRPRKYSDSTVFLVNSHTISALACSSPLPESTLDEQLFLTGEKITTEEVEEKEGQFSSEPLHVPGGVALTEEAVETATADIVALV